MKNLAVAFTGPSNSGKTTLVEKIAQKLVQSYQVSIIKNDPKDKASFDVEGKDSWKFSQTGADVAVVSPTRTTLFSKRNRDLDEMIALFGEFDYLLVEGLKTLPLPRIAIFRNKIDESYLSVSEALAIDESIDIRDYHIPDGLDILDLNDIDAVIAWIDKNSKKVR